MTALRIAAEELIAVHRKMLAVAPAESAAFFATEPSGPDLVVRGVEVFGPEHMDDSGGGVQLDERVQQEALARIKRSGHTLVEAHTHPGSGERVRFSTYDHEQLPAFARYVQLKMPGRGYGAVVFGRRGYEGLIWTKSCSRPLELEPVGEFASVPAWLRGENSSDAVDVRYDRQVRALGVDGQRRIHGLRVAVVGLGGTGSLVVQQLAHLGVRNFILIDDDRVEPSNLPRLAGAHWLDGRRHRKKSRVATRSIRRLTPAAVIRRFGGLRSTEALNGIRDADVIIGCVDNDGARLVMTELASAHLVPYLDIGVGVEPLGSNVAFGGRVAFYLPGGPCLACADELDFDEVAEDLESEAQHKIRIARGYARDRAIEPALMPLNTVCVGLAMTELLAFATGMRRVEPFSRYDGARTSLTRGRVELNPECPVCRPAHGMGDRQAIERYALPA